MARAKKEVLSPTEVTIRNIEKSMGNKTGMPFIKKIKNPKDFTVPVFSTGWATLDKATNCGGLPRGKMVEVFGPESSGKSLIALRTMASAQKAGEEVLLYDAEQSFDPRWATQQGMDVENGFWIFNEALCAETILDYVYESCKSGKFAVVVVDSTAALIPKKELDGSIGDQDYALLARAMSKACKKIANACAEGKCLCIFVNQIREVMNAGPFGNPNTTPGGKALKFYASMRLSVYPGSKIKGIDEDGEEAIIARKSRVMVCKNKVARPFGKAEFEIVLDAMAMNPVVKMIQTAKSYKLFATYKGENTINKSLVKDAKKNVATGTYTIPGLAHYVLQNEELMNDVLDELYELLEEEEDKAVKDAVDPAVYELKNDKSLWVSPLKDFDDVSVDTDISKTDEEIIAEHGDKGEDEEEPFKEDANTSGDDLDFGE